MLLAIPMEIRLAIVFVLGTCLGSVVNLGAYRLAYRPSRIGPWFRRDEKAPPRRFTDLLPIVGWLGLRREAAVHGSGFWIRPMLVELLLGVILAWLYWWEIGCLGLLPPMRGNAPVWAYTILHTQFAAHAILIFFMLVALLIDLDEWTIPDTITIPGTVIGLLLAAVFPWSLLPNLEADYQRQLLRLGMEQEIHATYEKELADFLAMGSHAKRSFPSSSEKWPFLLLTSVEGPLPGKPWKAYLWDSRPRQPPPPHVRLNGRYGLLLGLGCWWAWCLAMMPWTWFPRHGWRRAVVLCCARMRREWKSCICLGLGVVGSAGIVVTWTLGKWYWMGLLTALVGVAVSGGMVWAVRIIGAAALKREAMGFGDVTLMAMIGAFLGWQPCLLIFFLAPLAGLVIAVLRLLFSRERELPYGPYLCLASFVLIACWATIWNRVFLIFEWGWLVPVLGLFCLAMMGFLLTVWKIILGAFEK